jgi:hypothetical protein
MSEWRTHVRGHRLYNESESREFHTGADQECFPEAPFEFRAQKWLSHEVVAPVLGRTRLQSYNRSFLGPDLPFPDHVFDQFDRIAIGALPAQQFLAALALVGVRVGLLQFMGRDLVFSPADAFSDGRHGQAVTGLDRKSSHQTSDRSFHPTR